MKKKLNICTKALCLTIFFFYLNNFSYGQCNVKYIQTILEESGSIKIQGYSIGCGAITIHWNNPSTLPNKTINISDVFHEATWTIEYQSSDGLTPQMLTDNFQCGSTNFSFGLQCQNQSCFITNDGSLSVTCKPPPPCPSEVILKVLNENDIDVTASECLENGTYKITTSVVVPNNMNIHWSINAINDNSTNDTLSVLIENGDAKDISFTAISNDNTCIILPSSIHIESCIASDDRSEDGGGDVVFCTDPAACNFCAIGMVVLIFLFIISFILLIAAVCAPNQATIIAASLAIGLFLAALITWWLYCASSLTPEGFCFYLNQLWLVLAWISAFSGLIALLLTVIGCPLAVWVLTYLSTIMGIVSLIKYFYGC
ncbi:MAG TPA: hypothetical protein VFW07_28445 [Parafilimonas sp.]|nr:hypothetical protein [Parafilimonas sp.]